MVDTISASQAKTWHRGEDAVVAAKSRHDNPVSYGARIGYIVAGHDHAQPLFADPLRNHSVELLRLQGDIGARVLINHSASGAKTGHLGLKAREIMLFIAR